MSATAIHFAELFDPAFLAGLSHLHINVLRVSAGGRQGERLSRDLGAGIEFRDYRPYTPGDDLRAIDWNVYRRLGKVFVRLYEKQQDLPLYLMPDVSASMFAERIPRAWTGLRCALALASIGLTHHDSIALFPFAEQVDVRVKSMSGKSRTMAFAEHLARLSPSDRGRTNLADAIRRVTTMNLRRGLLLVISDFFDPGGIAIINDALKAVRHRLLFVQVARRSDAEPDLQGDFRLRDCETGDVSEVAITPHVLARYRHAYDEFNRALAASVAYYRGGLIRLDADADLLEQLQALLAPERLRL